MLKTGSDRWISVHKPGDFILLRSICVDRNIIFAFKLRMLIVSWNVIYKPAPSNANFQCVLQLNATSGCGSGLRGLREETVLKCVEMHSILNYNKTYWYIEHIRSVRIPRGDLCKACMLLNMLPGIQQRTECVFSFSLQSF